MIDRELVSRPIVRVAAALLTVCTVVAVWMLVVALNAGGPVTVPLTAFNVADSLTNVARVASPDIAKAVESDLFSPDRAPPDRAYRLPGEHEQAEATAVPPVRPVVMGTAVIGDNRSFATCKLGDAAPVIVRVGEKLGIYTVRTITRGVVRFTSTTGETFDIPAMKSGAP